METQILLSAEVTASGASNELVSNGKESTNFYVCAFWPSRWSSSSLSPSASSSPSCRLAIQRLRGAVNAFGRSIYTACRPDQQPLRHLYSPNNASINFHAYTHARIRGASVIKCALCVQTQSPSVSGGVCSGCSNVAREDACIGRKLWLVDGIISHRLF